MSVKMNTLSSSAENQIYLPLQIKQAEPGETKNRINSLYHGNLKRRKADVTDAVCVSSSVYGWNRKVELE